MNIFSAQRQRLPRQKLLSDRAEDILLFFFIALFGAGIVLLHIEFPNGIADLHLALISG